MFNNLKKYREIKLNESLSEKIGIFIKDGSVSADIRLLTIFDIIASKNNYDVYIISGKDLLQVEKDILNNEFILDYVIIQRNALDQNNDVDSNMFKLIVEICKTSDITLIYEIDDDLINMDKSNPGYNYYNSIKEDMKFIIQNSDIVTVSTNALKNTLSSLNKNIIVIPNRLIDNWFVNNKEKIKDDALIKIGYMGTAFHSWDLILIENAIKNVKDYFQKKGKTIVFELIGGTNDRLDWAEQIEVPKEKERYPAFVDWFKHEVNWDIVVAPLEDSALNHNKSELKYIEYTALGVPGIYSAIGPYAENIVHEQTGLLVYSNESEEWEKNIIRLIEDNNLRNKILINAKEDITKKYLIKYSVEQWEEIILKTKRNVPNINNRHKYNYYSILDFKNEYLLKRDNLNILDVGSINKKGNFSLERIFNETKWKYYTLDIENHNADIILENIYDWSSISDNSFDVIISSEFLECLECFWILIYEMARVLKPGGLIFLNSSNFNYCNEDKCFSISLDGLKGLANYIGFDIIKSYEHTFENELNNYIIISKDYGDIENRISIMSKKLDEIIAFLDNNTN